MAAETKRMATDKNFLRAKQRARQAAGSYLAPEADRNGYWRSLLPVAKRRLLSQRRRLKIAISVRPRPRVNSKSAKHSQVSEVATCGAPAPEASSTVSSTVTSERNAPASETYRHSEIGRLGVD